MDAFYSFPKKLKVANVEKKLLTDSEKVLQAPVNRSCRHLLTAVTGFVH